MNIKCAYSELVPLHQIIPNPRNPNNHPDDQIEYLAKIIDYTGIRHPIIISKRSGFIAAGHGRLMAAKILKLEKFPVDYQDFENEAEEYAFLESDNHLAELSEHDQDKMLQNIKEIPELKLDMLGIPDLVLPEIEGAENGSGIPADEVPEVTHDPIVKENQVWILGDHRLMCGDSTNEAHVNVLMNGEKADMVFTDPPYNQETKGGFKSSVGEALKKQSSEIEHMCDFVPKNFLATLPMYNKKGTFNVYIFCNKDLVLEYLLWGKENKCQANILIWKKESGIPIGGSHTPDIEYLMVFRKSGIFNRKDGLIYSKLINANRVKDKIHPTMKPVELIENQIQICSNDSVVDPFLGSGSTLIACEKTNRKCFGMEIDPRYCDVIIERWQKFTGNEAFIEESDVSYNALKQKKN